MPFTSPIRAALAARLGARRNPAKIKSAEVKAAYRDWAHAASNRPAHDQGRLNAEVRYYDARKRFAAEHGREWPEPGTRKRNPVPASRVKRAQSLGLAFTGHKPELRETLDAAKVLGLPLSPGAKIPLLAFGELMGVKYRTVRDGREELYEHTFRKQSRPLLAARHDGSRIYIVGGRYRFTDRGIVDR